MLNIFVNTWGNYNVNGADGGEWITLPMDPEELEEVLENKSISISTGNPSTAPLFGATVKRPYLFCIIPASFAVTKFLECVLSIQLALRQYSVCAPQPTFTPNFSA